MADYSAHFHEKFILKKSIIFVNSKSKMSYVHVNFPALVHQKKMTRGPHMTSLEFHI